MLLRDTQIIEVFHVEQRLLTLRFWMPLVPTPLSTLVSIPRFSPYNLDTSSTPFVWHPDPLALTHFVPIARSWTFQLVCALAYLHSEGVRVAHRDIKPSNVLVGRDGWVKLIDFGVSWVSPSRRKISRIWEEDVEKMYCQVGSGPYRAPELLFTPRSYDPFAIDLWALGCTLAELFTPLYLSATNSYDDEYDSDDSPSPSEDGENDEDGPEEPLPPQPFEFSTRIKRDAVLSDNWTWHRKPLFPSSAGDIPHTWAIFRSLGTPTPHNWPSFANLPLASTIEFRPCEGNSLRSLLPNLRDPPGPPLDIISRLLVYEPSRRLSARNALAHESFVRAEGVLIPEGWRGGPETQGVEGRGGMKLKTVLTLGGKTLVELMEESGLTPD